MDMKTIIVTGVTGQMGSHFSDFLLDKGFRVIGTVRRLSVNNHKNIEHITNPNFILVPMDLSDSHSINSLIEKYKPEYFINCAANSFVASSWIFPEQHMDLNALGVLRQLEAIKRFSPKTRYLNFGSSEEFGDVAYSPQDEKHPPRARSIYGASKIAARQIVKVYRESYNLFAVQCWCFNYESERRGEEFVTRKITKAVARIYHAIKNGLPFEPCELGNLDAKRDWSHALDFVDGIWRMINSEQPKEYVFASGETHTIREFVKLAFKAAAIEGKWGIEGQLLSSTSSAKEVYLKTRRDHPLIWDGCLVKINPEFFRPCEVQILHGDASLARAELGWSPKVSFNDLVKRMVASDIANFKP